MKAIRKLFIATVIIGITLIGMLIAYATPTNYVMMDADTQPGAQLIVTEDQVRLRDVINQDKVLKKLNEGTIVTLIENGTKFAKVMTQDGVEGMFSVDYLAIKDGVATPTPTVTLTVKPTATPIATPTVKPTIKPTVTPIATPTAKPIITVAPSVTPAQAVTPAPENSQRVWSDQRTALDKFKEIPVWAIVEVGVAVIGLLGYLLYRKLR